MQFQHDIESHGGIYILARSIEDVADIETAIGDEETAGSILARIKALEDAG